MNRTTEKGFTLIELLVVIAIIGLLSSIVFASLGGARKNARIAAAQGSMRNVNTAALLCFDDGSTVNLPTESITGGGVDVCSATTVTTTKYGSLPPNWVYCAGGAATATCTVVSVASPVKLVATGDGTTITCTENGCTKSP